MVRVLSRIRLLEVQWLSAESAVCSWFPPSVLEQGHHSCPCCRCPIGDIYFCVADGLLHSRHSWHTYAHGVPAYYPKMPGQAWRGTSLPNPNLHARQEAAVRAAVNAAKWLQTPEEAAQIEQLLCLCCFSLRVLGSLDFCS